MERSTEVKSNGLADWRGLTVCCALIALFLLLRCFRLFSAFLPQIDEISLLNQANVPFLAGGSFSSTYFPLSIATKYLLPFLRLGELRLLTVGSQFIGIVCLVSVVRRWLSPGAAAAFALLVITHWYFNYIGRLYDVSSFTVFFFGIHLFFLARWNSTQSSRALLFAAVAAGIGLDNYAGPWLYYLPFAAAAILFLGLKDRRSRGQIFSTAGLFLLCCAPFFYVLFHTDSRRDWSYLTQFSGTNQPLFPTLNNPQPFIRTFTETFSYHSAGPPDFLLPFIAALLAAAPAVLSFGGGRKNRFVGLALAGYVFQIAAIAASPVVPNHSGHFSIVLLFYFFLIAACLKFPPGRIVGAVCILAVAGFGFRDFAIRFAGQDQRKLALASLEQAENLGPDRILFSDGAYLKFYWIDGVPAERKWPMITCDKPDRFSTDALARYNFLFLTTECEGFLPAGQFEPIWQTDQLIEAHSVHGLSFYRRK